MSDQIGSLLNAVKAQDMAALARLLTLLEREGPSALKGHALLTKPPRASFRVGITGPPGAGKSTLISQLIQQLRARDLTVGVMAVDPSSPFSNGAILGDRIRYSEHSTDEKVFVRSLGSRGSLGGLSAASYLMLRAYDVFGFDIVLLETVGVGQTELEVMNVADFISVVLVPESGDSVQAMKAGLIEIADLYVVNKADRPGAESLVRELEASVALGAEVGAPKDILVLRTVATDGTGVRQLVDVIVNKQQQQSWRENREQPERVRAEMRALLRAVSDNIISSQVFKFKSFQDFVDSL